MAIGTTIDYSVAAVGTTVLNFAIAKEGLFVKQIAVSGVDVPMRLELRTSPLSSLHRRFGAALKLTPEVLDVAGVATKGRISVSLNVDAYLGSFIDATAIPLYTRYFMGAILKSTLIEALRDGSLA